MVKLYFYGGFKISEESHGYMRPFVSLRVKNPTVPLSVVKRLFSQKILHPRTSDSG